MEYEISPRKINTETLLGVLLAGATFYLTYISIQPSAAGEGGPSALFIVPILPIPAGMLLGYGISKHISAEGLLSRFNHRLVTIGLQTGLAFTVVTVPLIYGAWASRFDADTFVVWYQIAVFGTLVSSVALQAISAIMTPSTAAS